MVSRGWLNVEGNLTKFAASGALTLCRLPLLRCQFQDDWTPAHLTGGPINLYKEIALALKGVEWRQPGLVAFASKVSTSACEHTEITVEVPDSYEPKTGPNPWAETRAETADATATLDRAAGDAAEAVPLPAPSSAIKDLPDQIGAVSSPLAAAPTSTYSASRRRTAAAADNGTGCHSRGTLLVEQSPMWHSFMAGSTEPMTQSACHRCSPIASKPEDVRVGRARSRTFVAVGSGSNSKARCH
jgi:hypothetical protein